MSQIELQKLARQFADGRITRQQYIHTYAQLVKTPPELTSNPSDVIFNPPYEYVKQKRTTLQFIKNHHKQMIALLGTIGIFLSIYFNNFYRTEISPQTRIVVLKKLGDSDAVDRLRTEDLKLITELLIEGNNWNKDLVDDFIAQWSKLSQNETLSIKKSKWYRQFALTLSTEINRMHNNVNKNNIKSIRKQQTLAALADALIFSDAPETARNKPISPEPTSKPVRPAVTQTHSPESPKTTKRPDSSSSPANINRAAHKITSDEIVTLLNQFSTYFKAGHLDALLSLLPDNEANDKPQSISNLVKEYEVTFAQTTDREVAIGSIDWRHENHKSTGRGNYKVKMRMRDTLDKKTINATLKITLTRKNDRIHISNFELLNREETIINNPGNTKNTTQLSKQHQQDYPTRSELQDLVTRYVDAYESGDIDKLMTLFASASWTTDVAGLTELRQEYNDLFNSTTEREIFVNKINWSMKDGRAVGTGELALTHHSVSEGNVTSSKGKIRFITKRTGKAVLITHLFHIVNE